MRPGLYWVYQLLFRSSQNITLFTQIHLCYLFSKEEALHVKCCVIVFRYPFVMLVLNVKMCFLLARNGLILLTVQVGISLMPFWWAVSWLVQLYLKKDDQENLQMHLFFHMNDQYFLIYALYFFYLHWFVCLKSVWSILLLTNHLLANLYLNLQNFQLLILNPLIFNNATAIQSPITSEIVVELVGAKFKGHASRGFLYKIFAVEFLYRLLFELLDICLLYTSPSPRD